MKKIGIISIHYGVNFGSALQAVAMYQYLNRQVPDGLIEVINYIPPRFTLKARLGAAMKGSPKKAAHGIARLIRFELTNNLYKRYLNKMLSLSAPFYEIDTLKQRYADYDYLIAGSDQIWNSDYNKGIDPVYYLQFASKTTKKIAYAASFGKEVVDAKEWDTLRDYLVDFKGISLRERTAVDMMSEAGIEGTQFVLDPTFLLNRDEWAKYEKEVPECPKDYLLIYFLDVKGEDIIQLANRIAAERDLKTVLIVNGQSNKVLKNFHVDFIAHNLTPDFYIWLFRHASYIVTNSFHGVSFSINMERQFVALKRERYNSRLDSILTAMGLLDRYTETSSYEVKREINYQEVNKIKESLLHSSKRFLDEALDL